MPRLAGTDVVAKIINTAHQTEDDSTLDLTRNCLTEPNSNFSASFEVTLDGPYFLSVVQSREWYCNTAHGWTDQTPLLFNLKSGHSIDPASLLPRALRPLPVDDNLATWTEEKSVAAIKPLTDLYLSRLALDPTNESAEINHLDCADVLTHDIHDFLIWPDATAHALMLMPCGMPYIVTPCQNPVAIPVALFLKLHASTRLIISLAKEPS